MRTLSAIFTFLIAVGAIALTGDWHAPLYLLGASAVAVLTTCVITLVIGYSLHGDAFDQKLKSLVARNRPFSFVSITLSGLSLSAYGLTLLLVAPWEYSEPLAQYAILASAASYVVRSLIAERLAK